MEDKNVNLAQAAQAEAASRPVLGGQGPDVSRQRELNAEVGSNSAVAQAKKDLAAGSISMGQFNKTAGTNR